MLKQQGFWWRISEIIKHGARFLWHSKEVGIISVHSFIKKSQLRKVGPPWSLLGLVNNSLRLPKPCQPNVEKPISFTISWYGKKTTNIMTIFKSNKSAMDAFKNLMDLMLPSYLLRFFSHKQLHRFESNLLYNIRIVSSLHSLKGESYFHQLLVYTLNYTLKSSSLFYLKIDNSNFSESIKTKLSKKGVVNIWQVRSSNSRNRPLASPASIYVECEFLTSSILPSLSVNMRVIRMILSLYVLLNTILFGAKN